MARKPSGKVGRRKKRPPAKGRSGVAAGSRIARAAIKAVQSARPEKSLRAARSAQRKKESSAKHVTPSCPVVAIGASAGGLEAFTKLLQNLTTDTGMAFVLVQHLDPTHDSILTSLLARATAMSVEEVTDGVRLEPNHVYVIPRNTLMTLVRGTLHLARRGEKREDHRPIDHFFRSVAADQGSRAVGVILSGTATDGTIGLKAIRAEGGVTFAQTPDSAKYDGMPRSAIAAGCVDQVLPPEGIAEALIKTVCDSSRPFVPQASHEVVLPGETSTLERIFALLREATGTDFSAYKPATLKRRLSRRMGLSKKENLEEYLGLLRKSDAEVRALYEDFLIHVTAFFRDTQTFDLLRLKVFPALAQERKPDAPLRIWVPGCSTGDEAYSIAISLLEFLGDRADGITIQLFGTDISETAIRIARQGVYPKAIARIVPSKYLEEYFIKTEQGHKVAKRVRDLCVFAVQDLAKDPPVSRLDLISCRNVLIYLGPKLQRKVVSIFHYALRPGGYLVLGKSESIAAYPMLFRPLHQKHRLYMKRETPDRQTRNFFLRDAAENGVPSSPVAAAKQPAPDLDLEIETNRILMERYTPPGVVIDQEMRILHVRGDINPFLRIAPGAASLSLQRLIREELLPDVRAAINLSRGKGVPVRREGIEVRDDGEIREVAIETVPLRSRSRADRLLLVLFVEAAAEAFSLSRSVKATRAKAGSRRKDVPDIARLKEALAKSEKHLRLLMEERQAAEEELNSANEELQSGNEELQSTNEELQTSQEELQSINEELNTLNEELAVRNSELSEMSNDLNNLLVSVNVPIVMLGIDLRIRRSTPMAAKVLNIRPADAGRPFTEIQSNLELPDMEALLSDVIKDLSTCEMEVRDRTGHWHLMRIRPYRTEDNKIDGAVLTLFDIDQIKASLMEARRARDFAEAIVDTMNEPVLVLGEDLKAIVGNRSFYDLFRMKPEALKDQPFFEIGAGQWDDPGLRARLEKIIAGHQGLRDFEMEADFQRIGRRSLSISARRLEPKDGSRLLLMTMRDITQSKLARHREEAERGVLEEDLKESKQELDRSHEERNDLAARLLTAQEVERKRVARELHDDLSQRLAMLEIAISNLATRLSGADGQGELRALAEQFSRVSEDLRRVAYRLHPSILDHLGLEAAVRALCDDFTGLDELHVEFTSRGEPGEIPEQISQCLYRISQEGLRNISKHAGSKEAQVKLEKVGDELYLSIEDSGLGFDARKHSDGLGLLSMKERARLAGGTLTIQTRPGHGVRLEVRVPLSSQAR